MKLLDDFVKQANKEFKKELAINLNQEIIQIKDMI